MGVASPWRVVVWIVLSARAMASDSFSFRPPSIPIITGDPYLQAHMMGDTATSDVVRFWDKREREMSGMVRVRLSGGEYYTMRFLGACTAEESLTNECPPAMVQTSVEVLPTSTVFVMVPPSSAVAEGLDFELRVSFVSPLLTDDLEVMARPLHYVHIESTGAAVEEAEMTAYLGLSGMFTVDKGHENVTWGIDILSSDQSTIWMGSEEQNVVGQSGDKMAINWGYLYLAVWGDGSEASRYPGDLAVAKRKFISDGTLPLEADRWQPRAVNEQHPGLSATRKVEAGSGPTRGATFILAYDEVAAVDYFGSKLPGLWTQYFKDGGMADMLVAARNEWSKIATRCEQHDTELRANLTAVGGDEYAAIGSLAYRQTLSALKLVWNEEKQEEWLFVKEISTNGDMQTMDVIFPASPMLLYVRPELVPLMLRPVLAYAANETSIVYGSPYSPHQLGVYPIADATTESQEQMPIENSGNMMLMILGVLRAQGQGGSSGSSGSSSEVADADTAWFAEYMPMLKTWADYMAEGLPFPANQLSTDDMMGKFPNNTNLAAKGIIALKAFGEVCTLVNQTDPSCAAYADAAQGYAETWEALSYTEVGGSHYKMSFNARDSAYSLKYNLVWQKILQLDGPFSDDVFSTEVAHYIGQANRYGPPLESDIDGTRTVFATMTKADWVSWVAAMAPTDEQFSTLFHPVFDMANTTRSRVPLTDLYDTYTGLSFSGMIDFFIDRPVIGGVFARALLP